MYRGFRIVSVEAHPTNYYYNCRACNEEGLGVLFISGNFTDIYRAFQQAIDDYCGDSDDYRDFLIESVEWDEENQYFFGRRI